VTRLDTVLVHQALVGSGSHAHRLAGQITGLRSNICQATHSPALAHILYTLPGGTVATTRQVVLHLLTLLIPQPYGSSAVGLRFGGSLADIVRSINLLTYLLTLIRPQH